MGPGRVRQLDAAGVIYLTGAPRAGAVESDKPKGAALESMRAGLLVRSRSELLTDNLRHAARRSDF